MNITINTNSLVIGPTQWHQTGRGQWRLWNECWEYTRDGRLLGWWYALGLTVEMT
jgi:hypothetical protein